MSEGGTVQCHVLPPPILGWNTKDSQAFMEPLYALDAENFFSNGGTVDMRNGYRFHVKNVGTDAVGTVAELALQSGTKKLIAVANNDKVYDATSSGSAPTDLSNAGALDVNFIANTVNFRNLIFIKDYISTHAVYTWDGAAANLTASGFVGPGGNDQALCNPAVYKSRLYFCELSAASVWYGGLDAITGAMTEFDVQSVLTKGGYLLYAGGVSKQGDTDQEYFAFISSQGEVLLYQGENPGSVTWGLVGKYYMAPPIGYRSFFNWGPNLVIITAQGVVLLAEVLKGQAKPAFLTENISSAFTDFFAAAPAEASYTNGVYYHAGNMLIINAASSSGAIQQFVMNTNTGSWWKWTGFSAYSWTVHNNLLYFGGTNHKVFKADNGNFDEDPASDGSALTRSVKLRQAFNYLEDQINFKHVLQIRPIIEISNGYTIRAGMDADYSNTAIGANNEYSNTTDTTLKVYRTMINAQASGKAVAFRIDKLTNNAEAHLYATEIYYETGGPFA